MEAGLIVVLDIGKTLAKLSLWRPDGQMLERRTRPNPRIDSGSYTGLDAEGIELWVTETLREFAELGLGKISALFPVGHGAAAAVVRDGRLIAPPVDYEEPVPATIMSAYRAERDDFSVTGSPALSEGLNLGSQLYWLESLVPGVFDNSTILLWPQYWAWCLTGVAASEVTSLGCHSDLWRPQETRFTELAIRRGWAACLPPVRRADEVLGTLTPEWAEKTGLTTDVKVYCGLHDSNAALIAARGFIEVADQEATVLSTGTWFVAMRTPAVGQAIDIATLPAGRDCLVNVDAWGCPVPSARFMGGREIEMLIGLDTWRVDIKPDQPALLAGVSKVLAQGVMVLPTFAPGFGPFSHGRGRWVNMPDASVERRAAVCLYAALVADVSLDLIGAGHCILVEGRFAEAQVFVRALAALRPNDRIYVCNAHNDVSYGALRLLDPGLKPFSELVAVTPLEQSLFDYKARWHRDADRMEQAAV